MTLFQNLVLGGILSCFLTLKATEQVVLHLKGGDKLSGDVSKRSDHLITIQHKVLGLIQIPLEQVERQEILKNAKEDPETQKVPSASKSNKKETTNDEAPISRHDQVLKQSEDKPDLWKHFIDLGADLRITDNRKRETYGRFKSQYKGDRLRALFELRAESGQTDKTLSTRESSGHARFEWDLSNRRFLFNDTRSKFDRIRQIKLNWEDSAGFGYKWIEKENFKVNLDTGAQFQRQRFIDGTKDGNFALRLAEDLEWSLSKKLKLNQTFEVFPRFTDSSNNYMRFETNFRYLLSTELYLSLLMQEIYDPRPAKGLSPHDFTLRLSVGYQF